MIYSIVVTYNGSRWVDKCFGSLINSCITDHKIIAIDNGSTDNTIEIIREKFPDVEIIENKCNLGFGMANNLGIKKAFEEKADFVFLLNQDAWVNNNTLCFLTSIASENKDYGIFSPVHLSNSTNSVDELFLKYILQSDYKILLNDYLVDNVKNIYSVNFVNAAAWLIPIKTINMIGYFDSLFFMYGEDNNYIQRVKFHKLKIGIIPNAYIVHDRTNIKKRYNSTQILNRKKATYYSIILNPNSKHFTSIFFAFLYLNATIFIQFLKANFLVVTKLFHFGFLQFIKINSILKKRYSY